MGLNAQEEPAAVRDGDVRALANRFEALATSASDNGPARRQKAPKLDEPLELPHVSPPAHSPAPSRTPSNPRNLDFQIQSADAGREVSRKASKAGLEEVRESSGSVKLSKQTQNIGDEYVEAPIAEVVPGPSSATMLSDTSRKAPPSIPFSSRPGMAPSPAPSFTYSLSSPSESLDASLEQPFESQPARRTRTPPPIPASRRSRPTTPSRPSQEKSLSNGSAVKDDDEQGLLQSGIGVSSLAARFGRSPNASSSRQPSLGRAVEAFDDDVEKPTFSPSKALQSATQDEVPASHLDSHHGQNASLNTTESRPLPSATNIASTAHLLDRPPPPVPSPRPIHTGRSNTLLGSVARPNVSQSVPASLRSSPTPPALPQRTRSGSQSLAVLEQAKDEPSAALDVPPLPRRTLDVSSRPRADTTSNARPRSAGSTLPTRRRKTVDTARDSEVANNAGYDMPPPPIRQVQNGESRPASSASSERSLGVHGHQFAAHVAEGTLDSETSSEAEDDSSEAKKYITEMPDASFANRRPPRIAPERKLYPPHTVNDFALHGRYAVSASTHLRVWDTWTGETIRIIGMPNEHKVTAVAFVYTEQGRGLDGQVVWAGTKDGLLFQADIGLGKVLETNHTAHSQPVVGIYLTDECNVVTVCEGGKMQMWSGAGNTCPKLSSIPRTQRLGDKTCFVQGLGMQLWTSSGPSRHASSSSAAARSPAIRVYQMSIEGSINTAVRTLYLPDTGVQTGAVMSAGSIPSQPNLVYLAHETGHISVWEKEELRCLNVVKASPYAITVVAGVNDLLWTGNREGVISVYNTAHSPWKVAKVWKASEEPVIGMQVDLATLATLDKLHVASYGRENLVVWDGLLEIDWLEHCMLKRESEYSTYRDAKILLCSWNIDSAKPADLQGNPASIDFLNSALQSSLVCATSSAAPPDVIVFGLQEVVDLEDKKVTAKTMLLGRKKADALFHDQVSHQYMRWHDRLVQAVRTGMPPECPYTLLHAENLVGLQSLIFVKNTELPNISDTARVSVKTGMGGRYGNKGAILCRLVIDDSSICFVNCHLAAGQRATRQRNKDLIDILENKSAFLQPSGAVPGVYIGGSGQTVFEHELCFLSGDLNYRIDLTRSIVKANIRSQNINLLLEHDQLLKEMRNNQAFRLRSFREADIAFNPTYKFDRGTNDYDSSAKERIPAWCDRILYRVHDPHLQQNRIRPIEYRSWQATVSDHKPITGIFMVRIKKMDPQARQKVWVDAEKAWENRARDALYDAKRFHGLCS